MRKISAAEGIDVSLVWRRILLVQSLYPYHIQWVQALTPLDDRARVVFCQWLLPKCIVNTQIMSCLLMMLDSQGMTLWASIIPLSWVDDDPHTSMVSKHQRRFSISVRVGILNNQLLGPVVLPNRLSGAVYHHFFGEWFGSTFGNCASSSMTHVVHTWWGTISYSPHCQTAPEPDFQWAVDRTQRSSHLAFTILWP
jgi:hypothetical protein